MAPLQSRKRKSDELEDAQAQAQSTPPGSPSHKRVKISQSQKQALIDNLQLEVTERARHLRAHYALQCADLRARVERRVNRIPIALRKANMGELLAKYSETVQMKTANMTNPAIQSKLPKTTKTSPELNHPLPPVPQNMSSKPSSPLRVHQIQPPSTRGKKRKSQDIVIALDKENEPAETGPETLPVMKNPKRAKPGPASRQVSRTAVPTSVLSPRSHNSRTLPQSPIKDNPTMLSSPTKRSYIARPFSPLKPASPLKSAASAATSAISASIQGMVEHAKRGTAATAGKLARTASREKNPNNSISAPATKTKGKMAPPPSRAMPPERTVSQSSNHSTTSYTSASSSSTTVVKKDNTKAIKPTATATKKTTSAAKTALKKNVSVANKKVVVAEPAAGRRVLRKRN